MVVNRLSTWGRCVFLITCARCMTVRDIKEPPAGPTAKDCRRPANDIVRENCLPGVDSSEWDVNGAGDSSIQGFTTEISYTRGDRVDFKIKSDSAKYRIDVYRLGWYAGLGARRLGSFRPSVSLPQSQPPCYIDDAAALVDCGTWHVSASWSVPDDAVSGVYIGRLVREDPAPHWRTDASEIPTNPKFANKNWDYSKMPPCGDAETCSGLDHSYGAQKHKKGAQAMMRNALKEPHASHVYFIVRDDSRKADILFQTIDITSRAYNNYAAPSTYGVLPLPRHNFSLPSGWESRRAYKVSYNVPLIVRDTRAVNHIFNSEYPAIRWLEKHGYDVQYWTGVDAHVRGAEIPQRSKVYVSVGHDEYWSGQQRKLVEAARDQGVNLIFWSGNEVYWKVRFEDSPVDGQSMRTVVCYKESQETVKIDPNKTAWTGTFRDNRDINPEGGYPENALTGTLFTVNAWRNDPLEVPAMYANLRLWRNTAVAKLKQGKKAVLLKGLLGHEWDEDIDNGFRPPGMIRLSQTTVDNVQYLVDTGGCFDSGTATHHLVMYRATSGALVFGAGMVQWAWGLDNFHDTPTGVINLIENEYDTRIGVDLAGPDKVIQQATVNLFADMGVQPTVLGAGIVKANQSEDVAAPFVTAVRVGDSNMNGVGKRMYAHAQDKGGVVAAMEWSRDFEHWHPMDRDGLAVDEEWYVDLAYVTGKIVVRAIDDSLNIGNAVKFEVESDKHEL